MVARAEQGYNPKVEGRVFVLSGFFGNTDYELEDSILDNRGTLGSKVTKTTAAEISKNVAASSPKLEEATRLGVPVYTIEEFARAFAPGEGEPGEWEILRRYEQAPA